MKVSACCRWAVLLALLLCPLTAAADERLSAWSADFLAGKRADVLAAVEADLASGHPHPLAPDVWVQTRAALGREHEMVPPALAGALGRLPEMQALARNQLYVAMIEALPPDKAAREPGGLPLLRLLAAAADALDRFDLALDYRVLALSAFPESFDGLWLAQYHLAEASPLAHRRRLAELTATGGVLHGRAAGHELALLLSARAIDAADRLAMARRWLTLHPDDSRAWRFAGHQLVEIERFAEAAQAFARADSLYPFASNGLERIKALVRLGRMDEARSVALGASATLFPAGDTAGREGARLIARAMAEAGEFGRGRDVLDAALTQWPTDAGLLADKGRLELSAGRPIKAIGPLRRSLASRPSDREARQNLVQAWSGADMPVRAYQSFTELRALGQAADSGWLSAAMAAARRTGSHRDAVGHGRDYLDDHPQSHRIMRDVALSQGAIGAEARAVSAMRRSFDLHPPSERSLDQYLDLVGRNGGLVTAALADLRQAFPQIEAVWVRSDERLDPAGTERLTLADEAIRFTPMLAWPHVRKAWLLAGRGEGKAALATLDAAFATIPEGLAGQRAQIHYQRAHLTAGLDRGRLDGALADLDEFRRLGGHVGAYHRSRHDLFFAAGRMDEAAVEAWAWAGVRPDEREAVTALFIPDIARRLSWPRVFAFLHDMVERDPEDPGRRLFAIERHAGPGGSALIALGHALALARTDPGDARAQRGRDLRADLLARLTKMGRLTDLDPENGHLAMELADGRIAEWQVNPANGRARRYAEGPAWIEARWSADGLRLLSLADAGGNFLHLGHDGDRLASIEVRGRPAFTATLEPDGTVRLSSSFDSAIVKPAYNEALAAIEAWRREGGGPGTNDLPELPYHDPALDALLAAETAKDARPADTLATAAYLVEHVSARRAHAAQARTRLDHVIAAARADARLAGLGVEAVRLWHALALAAHPAGLITADWERWADLRRWVAGIGGVLEPRNRALAEFERRPLALAASGRWLARSWLGNPGHWRVWPAEQTYADGAKPLAALVRANGDLVLGTSTGLSVLRQGRWLHYAYSPSAGRFVAEEPGEALSPGPEVKALAEDAGGGLWLALGNALARLDGPFDGALKLARGPGDGIPEDGVKALAPFGTGVLAATSSGLRSYGRSGRRDLPRGLSGLAFVPAEFVNSAASSSSAEPSVLIGTMTQVLGWGGRALVTVSDRPARAALWLPESGTLALLVEGRIETAAWNGADAPGPRTAIAGQADLGAAGDIRTLARVDDDDAQPLVVAPGSKGMALVKGEHVEIIPVADSATAAAGANTLYLLTPTGVTAAEKGVVLR